MAQGESTNNQWSATRPSSVEFFHGSHTQWLCANTTELAAASRLDGENEKRPVRYSKLTLGLVLCCPLKSHHLSDFPCFQPMKNNLSSVTLSTHTRQSFPFSHSQTSFFCSCVMKAHAKEEKLHKTILDGSHWWCNMAICKGNHRMQQWEPSWTKLHLLCNQIEN